eukprot:scaffold312678_cov55-Prasinocladus_malaysianus.AAC.1
MMKCRAVEARIVQWDDYTHDNKGGAQASSGSSPGYDVVLGADVVYNPGNAVSFMRAALANLRDGGLLCVCSPAPSELRPGYEQLVERLHERGTVHVIPIMLVHHSCTHNTDASARLDSTNCPVRCLREFNLVLFWKNILALPPC